MLMKADTYLAKMGAKGYDHWNINCEQMTWLVIQLGLDIPKLLRLAVAHHDLKGKRQAFLCQGESIAIKVENLLWVNHIEGSKNSNCGHWEGYGPKEEISKSWVQPIPMDSKSFPSSFCLTEMLTGGRT
jgi:hypothetical protein